MKQDLHIFTGKGGVGKSVLALAYARNLALSGEKTLLVELGEASYYDDLYKREIAYEPTEVEKNLSISRFSGIDCLREYIAYLVKVRRLADLFFDNKVMRAFVDAAPGLKELAILGKFTSGIREWGPEFPYRYVVLDAYSSGHFLALLKAPLGLSKVIDMGPMGEQTRSIFKVLRSEDVHYHIVTLPEEMPTSESLELAVETEQLTDRQPDILLNKNFNAETLATASADWQKQYNEYMGHVSEKMQSSIKMLEDSKYEISSLPFVFDVSPLEVAKALTPQMRGSK